MRATIIIFFLATCYSTSFANDIAILNLDTLQERSVRSSDIIFLGQLFKVDTNNKTLSFHIIEIFKGEIESDSIEIQVNEKNPIYYFDYSLWLVYSNFTVNSSNILNPNNLTRSIDHPEVICAYQLPPPPPEDISHNFFAYLNKWLTFKSVALKDWYFELESLRSFKNLRLAEKKIKPINYMSMFYASTICLLLSLILIIYLLVKQRKTNR